MNLFRKKKKLITYFEYFYIILYFITFICFYLYLVKFENVITNTKNETNNFNRNYSIWPPFVGKPVFEHVSI